jgi:DNA-binding NarL/FixJ family response regulator
MPSSTTLFESNSAPESRPEQIRVLLVDDNQAMLERAAVALAASCLVVGQVQDGATALAAAAALEPDVIVLDISMPEMSGLEVAARLRAEGSSAAIVFLTVHDDAEFVQAAQAAGGIGYVVKPRLGIDLQHAVRQARARHLFVSPGVEPFAQDLLDARDDDDPPSP